MAQKQSNDQPLDQFLTAENASLRQAGCKLAEAALYVAREHDGVHRLMLAVSEWAKAIADEGGRHKMYMSPKYFYTSSNEASKAFSKAIMILDEVLDES